MKGWSREEQAPASTATAYIEHMTRLAQESEWGQLGSVRLSKSIMRDFVWIEFSISETAVQTAHAAPAIEQASEPSISGDARASIVEKGSGAKTC